MDIHRCRFVPYQPSSINALAFSHTSHLNLQANTPRDLRLALGRGNGDIEIWNPYNGRWFQETILRGGRDRTIDALAWTQAWVALEGSDKKFSPGALRLFSTGNSTIVTEWDLATGTPAKHADGNFGDLWCLAAQPTWSPSGSGSNERTQSGMPQTSQYLAAGCSDGTIVLFTTEDDELRFSKTLGKPPTKKPKVTSLTWRDRNILVAGYDDSTIRVYDIRDRRTLRSISLGKSGDGQDSVLIWVIKCLPNGNIVSGDSTGQLKIWDANNYSLIQSLQAHKADIMDLAISADGKQIISGGSDQRTVAYGIAAPVKGQKSQRWTPVTHRRFHEHDVKALASYESKTLSIFVSGGIDTVPVVAPLRELHTQHHRSLSHLPQRPQMCSATRSRLMITWWDQEIHIWHISRSKTVSERLNTYAADQRYRLATTVLLKDDENISHAHISANGRFIAVTTSIGVKMFQLRRRKVGDTINWRTRQVDVPLAIVKSGARLVHFSPDGHWLSVVRLDNTVVLVKISSSESPKEHPHFNRRVIKLSRSKLTDAAKKQDHALGAYLTTICSVAFSFDSRILAVGDISGGLDTWLLEGYEDDQEDSATAQEHATRSASQDVLDTDSSESDSDADDKAVIQGQKWIRNPDGATLPNLGAAVLGLSFRPSQVEVSTSPNNSIGNVGMHPTRHNPHPHSHDLPISGDRLVAFTPGNHVVEFHVLEGKLSDWSRRNPPSSFPRKFRELRDPAMGCYWDTGYDPSRLWLYGATWLFMFDMSQDLPDQENVGRLGKYDVLAPITNTQKKRKRDSESGGLRTKHDTGAGDSIRLAERYVGIGQEVIKHKGANDNDRQAVEMQHYPSPDSDLEAGGELPTSALASLRRGETARAHAMHDQSGEHALANGEAANGEVVIARPPRSYWLSFHYRSIFGMATLGSSDDGGGGAMERYDANPNALEVVIVERPQFEISKGLEPRFDGGQDWYV